jgi:hypothetical protein
MYRTLNVRVNVWVEFSCLWTVFGGDSCETDYEFSVTIKALISLSDDSDCQALKDDCTVEWVWLAVCNTMPESFVFWERLIAMQL